MNAQELQVFCADEDSKYVLTKPHVFIHPETKKAYSYATDGHRIVMVEGRVDGLDEYAALKITQFLVEPCGVPVNCADLKTFLECGKPTTRKCSDCGGSGKARHSCDCDLCSVTTEECGCDGKPERIVNYGWLGNVAFNRALLADTLSGVEDKTVLVHAPSITETFYIFASDRRIGCMPMRNDCDGFKDAPRFVIPKAKAKR